MTSSRNRAVGVGVIAAALVVGWALNQGRGVLNGLLPLLAGGFLAFFVGRAGWRWWKTQPPAVSRFGILGSLGFTAMGWGTVAIVHALARVPSGHYVMILVYPLMLVVGVIVSGGGLLAAAVGAAAMATGITQPIKRRALVVAGGAASVVLNLMHAGQLVRLLISS